MYNKIRPPYMSYFRWITGATAVNG